MANRAMLRLAQHREHGGHGRHGEHADAGSREPRPPPRLPFHRHPIFTPIMVIPTTTTHPPVAFQESEFRSQKSLSTPPMGNLVSQCVAGGGAGPLVVGPDGCRLRLGELAGVAELMIEAPGHVVARATDVAKERRVRPLAADELLRAGEVYLLVPAGRAGACLGDLEVGAIGRLVSGKRGSKGSRAGRRIFPEAEACKEEDNVEGKGIGCAGTPALARGLLRPRQWRPALDTIDEA